MTDSGWRSSQLAGLAEIAYGLTVNRQRRDGPTRVPYLTVANLQGGSFDLSTVKEIGVMAGDVDRYRVREGDILVVEGNANPERIGNAAVWRNHLPMALHQNHLIRVRALSGEADPAWLVYCLNGQAVRSQIEASTKTSSGLHTINSRVLSELALRVPPVPEQRKIAAILSSVDDAIDTAQAVIEQLGIVKKAMMQDLLTRGLPGRHTKFKKTEIGMVPEGWKMVTLDECIERGRPICYGILMPGKGHPGGVPVVKVKNIKDGRVHEQDLLLTSPELDAQYARSRLRTDDVLLSIRGTTGRVARVPPSLDGANITQDTARLSVRADIERDYVYYCLQAPTLQEQIQAQTRGQAVKGINIGDVRLLRVPLPSRAEQVAIAGLLEAITEYEGSSRAQLGERRRVKAALMSVLLTGEVRVKPDEEVAA